MKGHAEFLAGVDERGARLADIITARLAARNGDGHAPAAPTGRTLAVLSARELCALPDPPHSDELLGPLTVRGARIVVGGQTGAGKSTLAMRLVKAIVRGEEFLGYNGAGGRACVIDAEQGLKTAKRLLRESGLDDSADVDYLRAPDGLRLDSDDDDAHALEAVLAAGDYSVVVADPLYKLHGGDSNAEREAVDLMRRLDAWRERYRFALVLLTHCRKPAPGARFSMHELFGSSAFQRGAEVALGLERVRDGYSRLHFFKDRDGDLPVGDAWGLLFDREQGFRRDPDDGAPKQSAADKVRELLEAQPDMTKAQIVAATGYAERTVRNALAALAADGDERNAKGERLWKLEESE